MQEDDLNPNTSVVRTGSVQQTQEPNNSTMPMYFKYLMFDIRRMVVFVLSHWRSVLIVLGGSLFLFSIVFFLLMGYSKNAWSAKAVIHYQEMSDRLPSFYMPLKTVTIVEMFTTSNVFKKVSEELKLSIPKFTPSMLSEVKISMGKTNSGIINITASANSPKDAATIANTVADFGISEYLIRQNSSVMSMLDEKNLQRTQCINEMTRIRHSMDKFISSSHKLYPPDEVDLLKLHLQNINNKLSTAKFSLSNYNAREDSVKNMLKDTPKEEEYEITIDHTTRISLEGKLVLLKQLRKRYTDENPKVATLLSEIEDLKTQESEKSKQNTPSKITYRKNPVYENLQLQLMDIRVQKQSLSDDILKYEKEYSDALKNLDLAQKQLIEYKRIKTELDSLEIKLEVINKSIQNLEIMRSTAIPGLSILNRATPSKSSNIKQPVVKTILSAFFITVIYVFILVFRRLRKMQFISSREFNFFDIKDLGEISSFKDAPEYVTEMKIARAYAVGRTIMFNRKSALFVLYDDIENENVNNADKILEKFNEFNHINGIQTYIIKVIYNPNINKEYNITQISEYESCFEYSSILHVSEERIKAIVSEIERCKLKYGRVQVRIRYQNNEFAIAQLAQFVDSVIFMPVYNKTKKPEVVRIANQLKYISLRKDIALAGILTDSPRFVH